MTQTLRLVRRVYLSNEDFEGGVSGWSNNGWGDAVAQSATVAHSGQYSLKAGDTTSTYGQTIPGTTVSLNSTTAYICFAWVYIPSATPTLTAASFRVHQTSTSGTLMASSSFLTQANATRNSWFQVSIAFTTTSAGTYAPNIQFDDNNAGSHNEYLDDLRLYELLCDFQDVTDYGVKEWSCTGIDSPFGAANLTLDVRGSSVSDLGDNLSKLQRAIVLSRQNRRSLS